MRYFATLPGGQAREMDVEHLGNGRYAVVLDGVRHELDADHQGAGSVSLLVDGESYSVDFEESGDVVNVLLRDQVVAVDVADERRLRMRRAGRKVKAEGRQIIAAPMPGKVVKLLVKVGDAVAEGAGLVVVEAMKMENELKSPKAGKVVEIAANEGQTVEMGARLVVVE